LFAQEVQSDGSVDPIWAGNRRSLDDGQARLYSNLSLGRQLPHGGGDFFHASAALSRSRALKIDAAYRAGYLNRAEMQYK
jgi:hypothetical protein